MRIIGLAGKAGSGKDTAGALLQGMLETQGYKCTKLSFAAKLKDACSMFFGWDRERLEHDFDYKEGHKLDNGAMDPACQMLGMTRREVMQKFGTEAVRNGLHKDAWVIILQLAIFNGEYNDYDFGFLTDCRFENELKFVCHMGGTLMIIDRVSDQDTLTEHTNHVSETDWLAWKDWDHIIENRINPNLSKTENLEHLRVSLDVVFEDLLETKGVNWGRE